MKIIIFIITFLLNTNIVFGNNYIKPVETKETVIETYTFDGNVTNYEELIPNEINYNNKTYIKVDVNVEEKTRTETLEKTESVQKIVKENEKQNAINLFEKELNYNKDNLKGTLKLDKNSLSISKNKVENVTTYTNKKYTMYEDKTYYSLTSNDYSLLPKTIEKNGVYLKLISADFIKTNSNDIYNAVCKYGGTYTERIPNTKEVVKDYKATVTYIGTLEKTIVESRNVTVYYEPQNKETQNINTNNQNISKSDNIEDEPIFTSKENINNSNFIENNKEVNKILENQLFIICIIVLLILFVVTVVSIKTTKLNKQKEERSKNFEKSNYKPKKYKYKNKKNKR